MGLSKVYNSTRNNVFPDTSTDTTAVQSFSWLLKQVLIGSTLGLNAWDNGTPTGSTPWTVNYSCDGSTAGSVGDGVDRWTTTFTEGKLVVANEGTAHSWMVLKSANGIGSSNGGKGPLYLLIVLNNGGNGLGSGAQFVQILISRAGFTSGSTTARPTATDELNLNQGATKICSVTTASIARNFHFTFAADGTFFCFWTRTVAQFVEGTLSLVELTETRLTDVAPFMLLADIGTSTSAVPHQLNGTFTSSGVYYAASIGAAWSHTAAVKLGIYPMGPYSPVTGQFIHVNANALGHQDSVDNLWDDFPLYIIAVDLSSPTYITQKGRVIDMKIIGWVSGTNTPAQLSQQPSTGTIQYATVGNTLVPATGVCSF